MTSEGGTVYDVLETLVKGWNLITVRVRQDGEMKFMPLGEIRDQRLVYKIVLDLIKQAVGEQGIQLRRSKGAGGFINDAGGQDIKL